MIKYSRSRDLLTINSNFDKFYGYSYISMDPSQLNWHKIKMYSVIMTIDDTKIKYLL